MWGDGLQHLCQHFGWGGHDVAAFEPAFVTAHIGYDAARFLYDQCTGGDVPGFEVEFEETVEAAAGHGAQIERGGALPAGAVRVEARSVVIYKKPVSIIEPDYVWAYTDKWINFPWSTLPVIKP